MTIPSVKGSFTETAGSSTSSTRAITKPSGAASGDIYVVTCSCYGNATFTGFSISGFTQIGSTLTGKAVTSSDWHGMAVFARIYDGTEGSTFTVTASGGGAINYWTVSSFVVQDADVSSTIANALDGTPGTNTTTGNRQSSLTAVTTSNANSCAFAIIASRWDAISSNPSGWTEVDSADAGYHETQRKTMASAGSTGTATWGTGTGTQDAEILHSLVWAFKEAATVPAAISDLAGERDQVTTSEVDLTWSAPDNGGAAITDYEYRVDGGTWTSTGSTATSTTVTGVSGDAHTFEVRAVNSVGAAATSNVIVVQPTVDPDWRYDFSKYGNDASLLPFTDVGGGVADQIVSGWWQSSADWFFTRIYDNSVVFQFEDVVTFKVEAQWLGASGGSISFFFGGSTAGPFTTYAGFSIDRDAATITPNYHGGSAGAAQSWTPPAQDTTFVLEIRLDRVAGTWDAWLDGNQIVVQGNHTQVQYGDGLTGVLLGENDTVRASKLDWSGVDIYGQYAKRLAERPVDNGGLTLDIGSGDFTSSPFVTRAGSLLVALVTIDTQDLNGGFVEGSAPTPVTAGTTWTKIGAAAPLVGDSTYSVMSFVYMADSPGDFTDRTFSMTSANGDWDNDVNSLDVVIVEFIDALPLANQLGLWGGVFKPNAGTDPGAQSVVLGRSRYDTSTSYLNSDRPTTPRPDSYVIGVVGMDSLTTTNTSGGGDGYTDLHQATGDSTDTYLHTHAQLRVPGHTDHEFRWSDLDTANTANVYDWSMVAVEVMRSTPDISFKAEDVSNGAAMDSHADWTEYEIDSGSVMTNDAASADQIPNSTTIGRVIDKSTVGASLAINDTPLTAVNQRVTVSGVLVDAPSSTNKNSTGAWARCTESTAGTTNDGYMARLFSQGTTGIGVELVRVDNVTTRTIIATTGDITALSETDLHTVTLEAVGSLLIAYVNGEPVLWYDTSGDGTKYTTGDHTGIYFDRSEGSTNSQPFFKWFEADAIDDWQNGDWEFAWVARSYEVLDSGGNIADDGESVANLVQSGRDAGAATPDTGGDLDNAVSTPTLVQNAFGPGFHAIDFDAGTERLEAFMTGTYTLSGGTTLAGIVQFNALPSGTDNTVLRASGNTDRLAIIQNGTDLKIRTGAATDTCQNITLQVGVPYLIVWHANATAASSWIEVNGVDVSPATKRAVAGTTNNSFYMGGDAATGADVLVHALGFMEGEITAGQLALVESYATVVGATIQTSGPQTWTGTTATVELAATSGTFTTPAQTWTGTTATVELAATSGSFAAGAVTWTGTTATVELAATSGSFAAGAVTWTGTTATVELAAASGSFAAGAVTWTGTTATVELAATSGSFAAGAVTWTGTTATVELAAYTAGLVPLNLSLVSKTSNQVVMEWTGVWGATSYEIERTPPGTVTQTGITDTQWTDDTVDPGTAYAYRVRARFD